MWEDHVKSHYYMSHMLLDIVSLLFQEISSWNSRNQMNELLSLFSFTNEAVWISRRNSGIRICITKKSTCSYSWKVFFAQLGIWLHCLLPRLPSSRANLIWVVLHILHSLHSINVAMLITSLLHGYQMNIAWRPQTYHYCMAIHTLSPLHGYALLIIMVALLHGDHGWRYAWLLIWFH